MLNEAQQALITNNINFARWIVAKWVPRQSVFARDELEGIAFESFCRAAALYDPSRGCKFIHFAKMHVNQEIVKAIRAKKSTLNHDRLAYADAQTVAVDMHDDCIDYIDLHAAINSLAERDREIVIDYYFNGLEQSQIGEKHGLTEWSICMILKKAREKLKNKLQKKSKANVADAI
jgi:RNA polymerase sigma factor (sigma-70 family)